MPKFSSKEKRDKYVASLKAPPARLIRATPKEHWPPIGHALIEYGTITELRRVDWIIARDNNNLYTTLHGRLQIPGPINEQPKVRVTYIDLDDNIFSEAVPVDMRNLPVPATAYSDLTLTLNLAGFTDKQTKDFIARQNRPLIYEEEDGPWLYGQR